MEIDSIEYVQLQGWVRTNRSSGKIGFIELNDGTVFLAMRSSSVRTKISRILTRWPSYRGSAMTVRGRWSDAPGRASHLRSRRRDCRGGCLRPDYPLQKKRHSFEFLREIPPLRPRANTFYAVFRLRSVLS
ncbi:MAG: hypothetical protein V8T10_07015 [Merdibacter sp.]